nr:hypothetical protein [uncultured Duganella sp.]
MPQRAAGNNRIKSKQIKNQLHEVYHRLLQITHTFVIFRNFFIAIRIAGLTCRNTPTRLPEQAGGAVLPGGACIF